jgi:PTH2 family peptidyl-tRNA hydrolase
MRVGKACSQASHASMAFLTRTVMFGTGHFIYKISPMEFKMEAEDWLQNSFRKICVYVNSEQELLDIHQKALDNGLISHIVEDNGATEFNGVKTLTCCAIGPHWEEKFKEVTDHLPLL